MSRLLFEKTGNAVWISHLDLMRVFQRAFRRAGYLLKHTGGFNQHAYVSLALPLSVGTESHCEILDFETEQQADAAVLADALNKALPEGIRVLEVYETAAKLKYLAYLRAAVSLEYDAGIPAQAETAIRELFRRQELFVEKKTKKGISQVDIKPMIQQVEIGCKNEDTLVLDVIVCAQNPSLNPVQLGAAVDAFLPELSPDAIHCTRLEVYSADMKVFR